MITPPIPENERERQQALDLYEILDTEPDPEFDALTKTVATLLKMPMCSITLVDNDRQWFKSKVGIADTETHRDISFCAHAITQKQPLIVQNSLEDIRFIDHPAVTDGLKVKFYAGAQLTTVEGLNLGTLCVMDQQPRAFSDSDKLLLQAFARNVVNLMELKRKHKELERSLQDLHALQKNAFQKLNFNSAELTAEADSKEWIEVKNSVDMAKLSVSEALQRKNNKAIYLHWQNLYMNTSKMLFELAVGYTLLVINDFINHDFIGIKVEKVGNSVQVSFKNTFVKTWAKYNKHTHQNLTELLANHTQFKNLNTLVPKVGAKLYTDINVSNGITMVLTFDT